MDEWVLRVRIYPDEFSIQRVVRPPSPAELDRLTDAVTSLSADPPVDEPAAFASFASAVGPARALPLWRACVVVDPDGATTVDRSNEAESARLAVHGPAGLPDQLEVWLILTDGSRLSFTPRPVDREAIGADLDLSKFEDDPRLVSGELPDTWWLSYRRRGRRRSRHRHTARSRPTPDRGAGGRRPRRDRRRGAGRRPQRQWPPRRAPDRHPDQHRGGRADDRLRRRRRRARTRCCASTLPPSTRPPTSSDR